MKLFACLGASFIVATASLPATAQQQRCTKRFNIVRYLAERFSEKPVATGLSRSGGVIEVSASHKGGSWTIILTTPTEIHA